MARRVFIDTSRTATNGRKKRKPRVVFDGERVFEVDKLTKLKDVDEVFIDTLFPEIYEEVLELLKRDVKVYLLKDTRILKKLRLENSMKKSDENDAILLSRISREGFKPLTIQEMEKKVELWPLINKYELLSKRIKTLKQWIKNDRYDYELKNSLRLMEKDKKDVARKITEIFSDDVVYKEACKALGVKDSVDLAILLNKVRLDLPLDCIKDYLGLTNNKNNGKYDREMRRRLSQLANTIYVNAKRGALKPSSLRLINTIITIELREKALYKLEAEIIKILKRAWRTISNQTSDRRWPMSGKSCEASR